MSRVDFFYDYVSPYSYFANSRLAEIAERTGAEIVHRPILLGGLLKAAENPPAVQVPNKVAYMGRDIARWAKRYRIGFELNPHFPVNTVALMRGALVTLADGGFPAYHEAMFRAMWAQSANLGDPQVVAGVLDKAGLDAAAIFERTQEQAIKDKLKAETDQLVERGAFGAPTLFVGEVMFFGNDRLDFVEQALRA